MNIPIILFCIYTYRIPVTVRDKPHGPSFLQKTGNRDRLNSVSITVIKKNPIRRART